MFILVRHHPARRLLLPALLIVALASPPRGTVVFAQTTPIPYLAQWETSMRTFGSTHCHSGPLDHVYYDAERVYFQIADYTNDPSWNTCAQIAEAVYRDGYVMPNNGGAAGHWNFTTGLRMDYERTGDEVSKTAAILLSKNAAYAKELPLSYTASADANRETAYAILSYINTEALGEPKRQRRIDLMNQAYDHMDQWFVRFAWPGPWQLSPKETIRLAPFMVGLTAHTLIRDWEQTKDPRLIPALKRAADWMWANAWISSAEAMWYEFPDQNQPCCVASAPAADLNLLIAPMYAFLYWQTGETKYRDQADALFAGGVKYAWLGGGKQFNQSYWWSFDYVTWRSLTPMTSDTSPPVVALTAPTGGSVSGSIPVSATASDNVGVVKVQFTLDGANLGAPVTTAPYTMNWDTRTTSSGSHVLAAKAFDAAGNVASSASVTVTVVNSAAPDITPPIVSVTTPGTGTVSGTVAVAASAADNIGVAGVQFRLDGANLGAEDTASPYTFTWDTTAAPNGPRTLNAVARDAAGNRTLSPPVIVTVNNSAFNAAPLMVSSISASSITSSGATITWITNEPADSQVEYGVTLSYGNVTPLNPAMVTTHTVSLSGLASGMLHHYRLKSKSSAGGQVISEDFTFTTAPSGVPDPGQNSGSPAGGAPPIPAPASGGGSGTSAGGAASSPAPTQGSGTPAGASALPPPAQSSGTGAPRPGSAPGSEGPAGVASAPIWAQDVVWTGLVNVTATRNSLTKTAGCNGCGDAGAISQQRITSGDGYLEFTASENGTLRFIGLGRLNRQTGRNEIHFAIGLRQGGIAEIREYGKYRTRTTYVRGDVFRIAVHAGKVRYYKNGRLLYTGSLAATYPLQVVSWLWSQGATVSDAILSGTFPRRTTRPGDGTRSKSSTFAPQAQPVAAGSRVRLN